MGFGGARGRVVSVAAGKVFGPYLNTFVFSGSKEGTGFAWCCTPDQNPPLSQAENKPIRVGHKITSGCCVKMKQSKQNKFSSICV